MTILGGITIACNNDDNADSAKISKKNVLTRIKQDIAARKFYPNVKKNYENTVKDYESFLNQNADLINFENQNSVTNRYGISKEDYQNAVIDFYRGTFDENELRAQFAFQDEITQKYGSDYVGMLNGLVTDKVIPAEQRDVMLAYVDYYYATAEFHELVNITSIFAQYVNESDFTEFEKTGMLTLFENFKTNRKLFDETAPFDFLQFINSAPVGANGKPSLDTACGGTMVVNMLAGSLGGPLGFLGGCATGVWGCYTLGCFD